MIRQGLKTRNSNVRRYYPTVIANAKETQQYGIAMERELDRFVELSKARFFDVFIYELDKTGCERWESMLNITPKAGDSIEQRKWRILAKRLANTPYSERAFQKMLNTAYGDNNVTVSTDYGKYEMYLDFENSFLSHINTVVNCSRFIVPCNLDIQTRNTTEVEQAIYYSGYATTSDEITILTPKPIDNIQCDSTNYYGGYVDTVHDITEIKGGVNYGFIS